MPCLSQLSEIRIRLISKLMTHKRFFSSPFSFTRRGAALASPMSFSAHAGAPPPFAGESNMVYIPLVGPLQITVPGVEAGVLALEPGTRLRPACRRTFHRRGERRRRHYPFGQTVQSDTSRNTASTHTDNHPPASAGADAAAPRRRSPGAGGGRGHGAVENR